MKASRNFSGRFFYDCQCLMRNVTKMKRGIVKTLLQIRKNEAIFVLRYSETLKCGYIEVSEKHNSYSVPMITITHNNTRRQYSAVAIRTTTVIINGQRVTRMEQSFQAIPEQRDIKWLLENFFLKKLFRAIA